MTLSALLSPERIFLDLPVTSKKKLLEHIADTVGAQQQVDGQKVFCSLLGRERLGSTGIGKGFAIPHARLTGLDKAIGIFIRVAKPINFESMDNLPVDIIFAIIIPQDATDEHLHILSSLAKTFSRESVCQEIRTADSTDALLNIIEAADQ
ncbi:MAG: PTS system nitrogen regulatory IIA component [Gammaproteobacteria bacterium]|jgi:PTS system nitrogen regulatory IIA component